MMYDATTSVSEALGSSLKMNRRRMMVTRSSVINAATVFGSFAAISDCCM